ncbi:hypothetical protein [Clostridium omnivorum]|uniref:Camelysin metallo-endopeptidase n=1 Tax=Clostridium omnivorum TaxID=1604902 RepID=A0ABQ5N5P1_9CLOT|nr:hypothetical protein [Clostridium sp. E14]GLC30527.1 hypothetical protein bsdE14_19370 [Clostridium sp. E14]
MKNKKKLLIVLLGLLCVATSSNYTLSYFVSHQKVQNSINLSMGTIDTNFIKLDGSTPYSEAIVNINGLAPNNPQESKFIIKNTGSLTNKIALSFDNFTESQQDTLLPYLNYKITIDKKVYEGNLKQYTLASKEAEKYFQIVDENNQPILLKPGEKKEISLSIYLQENAPYSSEGKNVGFNINVFATQPNDTQWVYSN